MYVPLVALTEVSQMTAYLEKLKFLVRRGQMWYIAKEDPLGIVQVVQPEGSCFLGCAADDPLSQEI